ncbi:hypothetical protein [Variovorax sp.]|jgi:hypothetical protein|uniref:hypothetical protein n=1 Tax=unclassified Variovorax TaxID=663243 RepID=UPI0037DA19D4
MRGTTLGFAPRARGFAAIAIILALAGCGGGGGGGGGIPFIPPSASAPVTPQPETTVPETPAPATEPEATELKFTYEGVVPVAPTGAADFLAPFNAQGAKGLRYFGSAFQSPTDQLAIYVKDSDTTYTYELQPDPATLDEFRTQLANRGAAGFQWIGSYSERTGSGMYVTWHIYRKDASAATTFAYRVVQYQPYAMDKIIAEANIQGADGYYASNMSSTAANRLVGIYEKDLKSSSTYAYEAVELPDLKNNTFLTAANERGARGFRLTDASFSGPNGPQFVFVKDTTQNSSFSYYGLSIQEKPAKLLEQVNAEGAKGGAPLRSSFVHFYSSDVPGFSYFFSAKKCKGPLCKPAQNRVSF